MANDRPAGLEAGFQLSLDVGVGGWERGEAQAREADGRMRRSSAVGLGLGSLQEEGREPIVVERVGDEMGAVGSWGEVYVYPLISLMMNESRS